jgi:predicted metal-dependent enzyme (double-stranded beta helix superfamily)
MTGHRLRKHASATFVRGRRPGGIGELAARVSRACFEAPAAMKEQIRSALARAAADADLLSAEQRLPATGACYARHVLYADPTGRFTVVAIVWLPGQFSPPHAHHTWCAYVVYEGELQETIFSWNDGASRAEPLRTETRKTGYSCYAGAGLDQIHRLGNSGMTAAISIHVYGIESDRIATHVNRLVETTQTERGEL